MSDPILQRYTARTAVPAGVESDAENVEDLGGWGLLRGLRDRAVSLELRKKDDTVLAIPYALVEQILYTPADGITLRAAGREVRIRGRCLNTPSVDRPITLFAALARHRVLWVVEKSRGTSAPSEPPLVIETINW